jgi:hypothetical protein
MTLCECGCGVWTVVFNGVYVRAPTTPLSLDNEEQRAHRRLRYHD